jgi:hypothetical protein
MDRARNELETVQIINADFSPIHINPPQTLPTAYII